VRVMRLGGSPVTAALSVQFAFDNGGKAEHPTSCKGSWTIADLPNYMHALVVTSNGGSGPESATQCRSGVERYKMQDGKFVKL
jgi:hypothetical protein